jgi:signal transduction histidine kinase
LWMALNAFYNNPAIVGFGNENSVGGSGAATASQQTNDAFSQILKELVDNAVDSCREAILSRHPDQPSCSVTIRIDASGTDGVLRVTVGDNGVGIADLGTAVQVST